MTPLLITLLIVAGIALLIVIGYLNNVVENAKLERARLKIELAERLRRCGEITETFPRQLMSPALKLLLTRLELNLNQRQLALDKQNSEIKTRISALEGLIAQGEGLPIDNPPSPIQTEAKAKEVRYLLEALHNQIVRATQEGFLQTNEGKYWVKEIRHLLVLLHIEFFNNLGQQALQQNQPGQARLAFERGVQYLRKQQDPKQYEEQRVYLEKLLARANALVQDQMEPAENDENELTQGLKTDDDETWKKKAVYD
ncbi:hypothetical protein [Pseudomonas guariconensis]|uniref:hypothetical protein n=1 Tax=Pseudomonas guariconensis TaxID=1288410 RepID=UPI0018AA8BB9|nr:hypothetical protein [Pseudomonas guariconensis]MBF8743052.1 hypothetical protein [Pseudomonas guariconensis]MBF8753042.1 hypothetical protein [Pseudomonas guariconensis]